MIGQVILNADGKPVTNNGTALSPTQNYNPPLEIKQLWLKVQKDYQVAWQLQRKPLDEFDGLSLLERARKDQETFAAFVGVEYVPKHKQWRWRGRRNTARNKLIGILAHLLAGILFPFVHARNERNEDDKMAARTMRILVEDALKQSNGKRGYEITFLYMALSALVNPAVFVDVEYVEAFQNIKVKLKDGSYTIKQAVDEILSGLNLHMRSIDEVLLGDFWSGTGAIQLQPYKIRVRRISYDTAKGIYGNHEDFKYVEAGKTRWLMNDEAMTLFDVPWDEADGNFVQELNIQYRQDDNEFVWVGGVFMGVKENPYVNNPMKHRRLVLSDGEWISIPMYNTAMSGFEPIDPTGRFAYYKSGAFKEYWDYLGENKMDALLMDGTTLDVMKPLLISGVGKVDSMVMVPGGVTSMPKDAKVDAYALGPNLSGAIAAMRERQSAMSESTQDKIQSGIADPNVTATATIEAKANAQVILGISGLMIADLVKQVGELAMDCVIQHTTVGKLDATVPEALAMKYKTVVARGREKGRDVTNRIVFTDRYMRGPITKEQAREREWELFEEAGGEDSNQYIWETNPYQFARTIYSMGIDVTKMTSRAMGTDRMEKDQAFARLTDPRVMPFIDAEAVATEFVIEEYADGDPERFKRKTDPMADPMLQAMMGGQGGQQLQEFPKQMK